MLTLLCVSIAPMSVRPVSCAVLVPSYRRPHDLRRCLGALGGQTVAADQIVVVLRADDVEGLAVVAAARGDLPITQVLSNEPGQVAALNNGLRAIDAEITAITDDDAMPRPDWIQRLLVHFTDPCTAGVGGRDVVAGATDGTNAAVGRITRWGATIGNHHRGVGPVRSVDVLKGANMAFRTSWLQRFEFDPRLRGVGAQVHNDLMICIQIRRAGGELLYDPEVLVDHYPAERPSGDDRTLISLTGLSDEVHNETLALLEFLPAPRRIVWLMRAVLRGTRRNPGLGVGLALLLNQGWSVIPVIGACCRGRWAGTLTWYSSRSVG